MTKPMRLFLAINLADCAPLRDTLASLRSLLHSGTLTAPQNLHMTLNFIGETTRAPDLARILDEAARAASPFRIHFGRLGHRGRSDDALVWLRGRSDDLLAIQAKLTSALRDADFAQERRAFLPHVTLVRRARFPAHLQPEDLRRALAQLDPDFSVPVRRICLMSSEREQGALVYREIHSAPFQT